MSNSISLFTPAVSSRSCHTIALDYIKSFARQILYSAQMHYHRMFASDLISNVEWKRESAGLVVLVHGLRSYPAAWFSQIKLLKRYPMVDLSVPSVTKKGMCSLEEAAFPILEVLKDYAEKYPGKPIGVLGVSNGSRIATWLEVKMRKEFPKTPMRISTIAGVHFGSSQMNLLKRLGAVGFLYPQSLSEELAYGSRKAKELLNKVSSALPKKCAPRSYEFFATTEDLLIPDNESSLPVLGKGEKRYLLHGHSHDSIVTAVAKKQVSGLIAWMRQF